jgi:hypothetical protein
MKDPIESISIIVKKTKDFTVREVSRLKVKNTIPNMTPIEKSTNLKNGQI